MTATASLLDMVQSDNFWPEGLRGIYCSVTGTRWGTVDEAYIQNVVTNYSRSNNAKVGEMISRMVLMTGPSPMWQSMTPERIAANKSLDPCGFLVYMINNIYRPEVMLRSNIAAWREYRLEMIALRLELGKLYETEATLIDNVNNILLHLSGKGYLPARGSMPGTILLSYSRAETLRQLLAMTEKCLLAASKKRRAASTPTAKNPNHERASLRAAGFAENAGEMEELAWELILFEIFHSTEQGFGDKEKDAAYDMYGVRSGAYAELKRIEAHQRAQMSAPVQPKQPRPLAASAVGEMTISIAVRK